MLTDWNPDSPCHDSSVAKWSAFGAPVGGNEYVPWKVPSIQIPTFRLVGSTSRWRSMKVDARFGKVTIGASAAASGLPNRVSACPPSDCATALAKSAENCGSFSLRLIQNTAPWFEGATVALRKRTSTMTRCEKSLSGRVSSGVCVADHQTPPSSSETGNAPPSRTVQSRIPSPLPSYFVGSELKLNTQLIATEEQDGYGLASTPPPSGPASMGSVLVSGPPSPGLPASPAAPSRAENPPSVTFPSAAGPPPLEPPWKPASFGTA